MKKRHGILGFLIVISVALWISFFVPHWADLKGNESASFVGFMGQKATKTQDDHNSRLRKKRFRKWKEEQQAAIDLAAKMGAKQKLISSDTMHFDPNREPFPAALIKEATIMKAAQLRVVVKELGKNPEIREPNRAFLVTEVTLSWLKAHEAEKTQSLRVILEIIGEVLPKLPRGFDTLPVSCAMGHSLEWDHAGWTDFMETHWNRWSGPHGNRNAEVMRRDMLKVLDDPQLRIRVENLPRAGAAQ